MTAIRMAKHASDAAEVVKIHPAVTGVAPHLRRVLPGRGIDAVGPFIFLDHIGPVRFAPGEGRTTQAHPHRGFETLTYLLEGRGEHRDSLGNVSTVGAGEVQWMRAGRGIMHQEGPDPTTRRDGGSIHGLQFWVDLPPEHKMSEPEYRHVARAAIPTLAAGTTDIHVIAGTLAGHTGPVTTFADPFMAHLHFSAPHHVALNLPDHVDLAVYVAGGTAEVGERYVPLESGALALLGPGTALALRATGGTDLIVFGGPRLTAPIRRSGPFVMNSDEQLRAAMRDFQGGLFGQMP